MGTAGVFESVARMGSGVPLGPHLGPSADFTHNVAYFRLLIDGFFEKSATFGLILFQTEALLWP